MFVFLKKLKPFSDFIFHFLKSHEYKKWYTCSTKENYVTL